MSRSTAKLLAPFPVSFREPSNLRWFLFLIVAAVGCSTGPTLQNPQGSETGMASYYAHKFHGEKTASGEVYDENGLTAAHRKLPFGTQVRVTNLANGKKVVLLINDRGPFAEGRIIDVSYRAAQDLDFVREGLARVRVEVVGGAD